MNSFQQITINNSCSFEGVTLHSGEYSKITLHPSPANTGIKFKRIDSKLPKGQNIIPANFKNIRSSQLCTTIENDYNLSVSTIEHLMAALHSYGIDNLLIDSLSIDSKIPQKNIIRGDQASKSISSASIIAKVSRDNYMINEISNEYPNYSFEKNKGYGTKVHMDAIKNFGITNIHRKSFEPIKSMILEN